jgi:hypothetical protein
MPINTRVMSKAGLDTRDLINLAESALLDDCENTLVNASGDLVGRPGYQARIVQKGGYGICRYIYQNSNNTSTSEILLLDSNIHRVSTGTLNIGYTGSYSHIKVSVTVVSGVIRLKILENGVLLMNRSLGQGFEESSTEAISTTSTAIDALANITSSVTGTSTVPAACLAVTPDLHIPSGQTGTIEFYYTTQLNTTVATPLLSLETAKTTDNLKNVSAVTKDNLLFLADGGYPHVYDGQAVYLAGLPQPAIPTSYYIAGDLDTDVVYSYSYQQTDARGKVTESRLSDELSLSPDQKSTVLTLKTVYGDTGYNTGCAIINGDQTATSSGGQVTLTVDNGLGGPHTLLAGDQALLLNRTAGINTVLSYTIVSVTATTVVVTSTETITVLDNDVVSNGLQINLYKAEGVDATKYLIAELPNNSFEHSLIYTDAPAKAVVNGSQTAISNSGQVILTVDAGSGVSAGNVLAVFNYNPNVNSEVLMEVVSLSGTQLILKSTSDVIVVDNQELIIDITTYPPLTDYVITQGPPPQADFCESYKGNLILAKGNRVYYSDDVNTGFITSSQSFPSGFVINFPLPITALIVAGDYLYVGMETRIEAIVSSALDSAPYNRIVVSDQIGIKSQSGTLVQGQAAFFISDSGIYKMMYGQLVDQAITAPIDDMFKDIDLTSDNTLSLKRAVAFNDFTSSRFLFYIPEESSSNTDFATNNSITLVYDYDKQLWHKWTNFHMSGGALMVGRNILTSERKAGASLRRNANVSLRTFTDCDYNDHISSIAASATFKWDTLGGSGLGIPKKIKSVRIFSKSRSENRLTAPTIYLTIYKDLVDDLLHTSTSFTFKEPGSRWNEFLWNDRPIGSWKKPHAKVRCTALALESAQIKLSATLSNSNFNISALELDWEQTEQMELKD